MNIPVPTFELTRWRELDNPISPLDPIQPDSPRYEAGRIPAGFVVLLWDGRELIGPKRFRSQQEADGYVSEYQSRWDKPITHYLIIPKP